jgi:hypothetical protein
MIDSLKTKLERYSEVQDKIVENNKTDGLLIKAKSELMNLRVRRKLLKKYLKQ